MDGSAQIELRRDRPEEFDEVAELYWQTWHESQASLEPPDVRQAKLDCIVGNDGGRRFYQRYGWRVTDEIDDPDPIEGQSTALRIWLMVKDLDRS